MGEMSGALQNRIAPPVSNFNSMDFSDAKVDNQVGVQKDAPKNKTDFRDLLSNSMQEVYKKRDAEKLGDLSAGTEAEFFEKLAAQSKPTREAKKELGKDDFLQLFVAQLQNQDPLNPDDGTEMASKLAQFNGLEQMMNMNTTMTKMMDAQNVGRNLQMANYVGKDISIDGGRVRLQDGKISNSSFELNVPATKTTLSIRDSTGMTVYEQDMGSMDKGTHQLKWDGKNSAGNDVSDGLYNFSLYATSIEGEKIPVDISSHTTITGVDVRSSNGELFTDLGKVKLENIKSVGQSGFLGSGRPAEKAAASLKDKEAIKEFEARKAEKEAKKVEQNSNEGSDNLEKPPSNEPLEKVSASNNKDTNPQKKSKVKEEKTMLNPNANKKSSKAVS